MKLATNDVQRLKGLQKWVNYSVEEFLKNNGSDPKDVMQAVFQDLRQCKDTDSTVMNAVKKDLLEKLDGLREDDLGTLMASFISCLDETYILANAFLTRGGTHIREADAIDEDTLHYANELKDVHDRIQATNANDLDIDAVSQQLLMISEGYRPTFRWVSMSINNDVLAAKKAEASDAKASILANLNMVWQSMQGND